MSRRLDIWAVVPIKDVMKAKQRLGDFVPANLRPALSLVMCEDVLSALAAVDELAGILVVTADPSAVTLAHKYGARIYSDEAHGGHTAVVAATARFLVAEGRGGMLQIPGDIPLVTPQEIITLLDQHGSGRAFTICPSRDFHGSNAIVLTPPDAMPLSFGDDSFYPHLRAAEEHGLDPKVVQLPGIGHDIDNPEDLRAFMHLASSTRTQRFLEQHGFTADPSPSSAPNFMRYTS
jgi:2-phospho-L-lactate guanylyltransferase